MRYHCEKRKQSDPILILYRLWFQLFLIILNCQTNKRKKTAFWWQFLCEFCNIGFCNNVIVLMYQQKEHLSCLAVWVDRRSKRKHWSVSLNLPVLVVLQTLGMLHWWCAYSLSTSIYVKKNYNKNDPDSFLLQDYTFCNTDPEWDFSALSKLAVQIWGDKTLSAKSRGFVTKRNTKKLFFL